MQFYDSHLHEIGEEIGGFLIGGYDKNGELTNHKVLSQHCYDKKRISFYHLQKCEIRDKIEHPYLKYHPRLEKLSFEEVLVSIARNQPKCVIVDTLNEPFWDFKDYWNLAREFSNVLFLLAHSGGYAINDFLKICHFQQNVWIDFAHTQSLFCNANATLPYIKEAICYALKSDFRHKILLGSDYPLHQQQPIIEFYMQLESLFLLNNNFDFLWKQMKCDKKF